MFCSNTDNIPIGLQLNCVYEFNCPGCSARYIGKTDRNLDCRAIIEHGTHHQCQDTIVYKNLTNCSSYLDM